MKKRIALSVTALALFVLPLAGHAQQAPRNPGDLLGNPRALARYLRLTPEQTTTYRQLRQELQATVQPLQTTRQTLRRQLEDGLEAAARDACAIGATSIALYDNHEQIEAARQDFDDAFSAILTPQQLARYEALKEAVRQLTGNEEP